MRRRGERVHVKGEEKFLTKQQKQIDANMRIWKEQQQAIRLHQRKGDFARSSTPQPSCLTLNLPILRHKLATHPSEQRSCAGHSPRRRSCGRVQ